MPSDSISNDRKKPGGSIVRASGASRNPTQARESCQERADFGKVEVKANGHGAPRNNGGSGGGGSRKASCDMVSRFSRITEGSKRDGICALPEQATASNGGFVWATRRRKHGGGQAE